MSADPVVRLHIQKALNIHAQWERGGLPLEWTVTAIYYESLHWLNATIIALYVANDRSRPDMNLHRKLRDAMDDLGDKEFPRSIRRNYFKLEALSRQARYGVQPHEALTNADVERALKWFIELQNWAQALLTADGYTCT